MPPLSHTGDGYDEARRVFNGMIDRRPLSVTGGRHSVTGSAVSVGGLTLGSGWLERKLGYSCGNGVGAEVWTAPADDANIAHTRGFVAAMKPWATGRVYLNFIGDEGADRVVDSYGIDTFRRVR